MLRPQCVKKCKHRKLLWCRCTSRPLSPPSPAPSLPKPIKNDSSGAWSDAWGLFLLLNLAITTTSTIIVSSILVSHLQKDTVHTVETLYSTIYSTYSCAHQSYATPHPPVCSMGVYGSQCVDQQSAANGPRSLTDKNWEGPAGCPYLSMLNHGEYRFPDKQGKSEGFESCDRPIVRKRPIRVKSGDVLSRVTLKFDGWLWKTIGHLSFAVSSFVQHFITISEFKLELLSRNAQFR